MQGARNAQSEPAAAASDAPRPVIGRREWLALPDLGVFPLNSKVDSGARTSSLHAEHVELSDDLQLVRFVTRDHYGNQVICEAPVVRFGRVRSSTGVARKRVFIRTTAAFPGGLRFPILLSLADRSDMKCPILLGRRALAGRFLIDPQAPRLLGTRGRLEREMSRPDC